MPVLAPAPRPQGVRTHPPAVTVLLADGDEVVLDRTRQFLLLHGCAVETAAGGVDCVRQLRRLADPVLVLDFELLWGGGDGVLALLREDSALARTPVILTTNRGAVDRARLGAAPVRRVLPKPVAPEFLLKVIRGLRPTTGGGGRGAEGRS